MERTVQVDRPRAGLFDVALTVAVVRFVSDAYLGRIATGPAFVGNVEAVDRAIWTVIGDTVNLAARLQALTRELAAAIIIDSATCARLETHERSRFVRRAGVDIRGRRQREDLYAVPIENSAAAAESSAASDLRRVVTESAR